MASDTGRDDFIIAIRSAFLKKGTRQKFSLFTLLLISIFVLSLEYFKSGPVNTFRSITKDIIFKGSFFISEPFVYIKKNYNDFKEHLTMYDEFKVLKNIDKRFSKETGLPVNIADDPLSCVAIGTGKALDQEEIFSTVLSEY